MTRDWRRQVLEMLSVVRRTEGRSGRAPISVLWGSRVLKCEVLTEGRLAELSAGFSDSSQKPFIHLAQ